MILLPALLVIELLLIQLRVLAVDMEDRDMEDREVATEGARRERREAVDWKGESRRRMMREVREEREDEEADVEDEGAEEEDEEAQAAAEEVAGARRWEEGQEMLLLLGLALPSARCVPAAAAADTGIGADIPCQLVAVHESK